MRTMREMGCNDIRVRRGVEDGKAFAAGLNNTTTAYDLMLIFEQLAQKKVVDAATSEGMLAVLRAQKFRDMIPALLPPDVLVAHKTGSITNVQHDSGIITLPDGRQYVLVLLSRNLKNNKDGIEEGKEADDDDWRLRERAKRLIRQGVQGPQVSPKALEATDSRSVEAMKEFQENKYNAAEGIAAQMLLEMKTQTEILMQIDEEIRGNDVKLSDVLGVV